jgi:hypothetical protein
MSVSESRYSISESRYSISDTVSVSEYSNRIFMMSLSNRIISNMVDTTVFGSKSGQKYENNHDISDIRSYSIRFHP